VRGRGRAREARRRDRLVLGGAFHQMEAQELFLGLGKRAVQHHASAGAAQGAGLSGLIQPSGRPELPAGPQGGLNFDDLGDDRGVLLRRPGQDFVFHMIGQDGVQHRHLVVFLHRSQRT